MAGLPAPRLKYRVLDNNTGAVIIPDLPHMNQSSWTVRALQQGYPGATSLGDFRIRLPPAGSNEGKRYRSLYDLLAHGQRVEAFSGDVITGTPKFSGIITFPGLERHLAEPSIVSGADSLWALQQSQMLPGEQILAPFTPKFLVDVFKSTRECVWDDDFSGYGGGSGPHPSTDYTASNWNFTASDPYYGKPAVWASANTPTIAYLTTNTTWGVNSQYAPCIVTVHGVLDGAGTPGPGTVAAEAAILLLTDATAQNAIMVRCTLSQTGASTGLYNVEIDIFTIVAGTYALVAQQTNALTNQPAKFPFELSAVSYQWGASRVFTATINGQNSTAQYLTASVPLTPGGIGLRWSNSAGGAGATVYVNRLTFQSRPGNWGTQRFTAGSSYSAGPGTVQNSITGSSQTHLDMLLLASSTDGQWLRKTPGYGYKADALDYAVAPGVDRSSQIVFEEGRNVGDSVIGPVSDLFATDAKVNALPGGNSGGSITWSRLAAAGDMILTDSVADIGVPGFDLLVAYAQLIQDRKTNPMQAIQLEVLRTAATADVWRELDYVTVHLPSLGVYRERQLIIGYTYVEGQPTQTVWLGQFPDSHVLQQLRRMVSPIEFLTTVVQPR
jgi:hypothetical protein